MLNRPVDPGRAGGVVHDEEDPIESETGDHGIEIALLVLERVVVPLRLVRVSPTEEVEHDDVAAAQCGTTRSYRWWLSGKPCMRTMVGPVPRCSRAWIR